MAFTDFLVTADGKRLGWRAYLILSLLALAFFLPGFSSIPPVDRDEPRFAQATKQMIETGRFADIRFQEETRYKKPVGIYWLQAVSVKLLSPGNLNEIWAYRAPSLLGAVGSVLFTAAVGNLLFGPMAGFLAAVLLACCLLLNVEARLAKTDAFMLLCVMASQYAMAKTYVARLEDQKSGWRAPLLFWAAQGVGFLIKGPILLLVTLGTLFGLRLADKNIKWFRALRPEWGIPLALLIAAPWFVIIMIASHGEFAVQSAGNDMLAKIWQGQNRGMIPPGLHLITFPVVFFPGSLLAMLALPAVWKQRGDPRVRFCLSWIIPIWLLFELSLTKLPHYVLPAYPAIALLTAFVFTQGIPAAAEARPRWLPRAAITVWIFACVVLLFTLAVPFYITGQPLIAGAVLAGACVIFMQAACLKFYEARSPHMITAIVLGGFLFTLFAFGMTFPGLDRLWMTRQVMQAADGVKPCPRIKIASAAYNEPSLIFLAGTDTRVFFDGDDVAASLKKDSCLLGLIDSLNEKKFLSVFRKDAAKPEALAHLGGPNIGSGKHVELTLYRLPQKEAEP